MAKGLRSWVLFILVLVTGVAGAGTTNTVLIVNDKPDNVVLRAASARLKTYLQKTYTSHRFVVTDAPINDFERIHLKVDPTQAYEAYRTVSEAKRCTVSGGSARAVLYGVTDLLEQLGWQFYLSYELPPLQPPAWDLTQFATRNIPLVGKRIIFNWHNFLSGCTGWDLEQWQQWTEQASKMKFNTIMVHAYANNPMNPFAYKGQSKALGYLSTTQHGRDWGTQHVNDARRLIGGNLFNSPVFGAQAAQVPEADKSDAAVGLMQKVFRHAANLGLDVCFAVDFDTWMANPQNVINTLPPEAHISIGEYKVANPEHPEGYQYYKTQITTLLGNYPEITQLAFWTRRPRVKVHHASIWLGMTPEMMPASWRREYQTILQKHPQLQDNSQTSGVFAVSKIAKAVETIIQEIKPGVELCYGSWGFDYTPLGDIFFPPSYGIIPLDYSIILDREDRIDLLTKVGRNRTLYPIVWAHHDDHRYNGRPYVPFTDFNSLLEKLNAEGFGIIHWKTHPLDLYFQNTARQVWQQSKNEPYPQSVRQLASGLTLSRDRIWEQYLEQWYTESPMFGRETSDYFLRLDHPYSIDGHKSALDAVEKAKQRLALLKKVNQSHLTSFGKKAYNYHQAMEHFAISFFNNHYHGHQATQLLKQGQVAKAREHAGKTNPKQSIQLYADMIQANGPTRGELGIVVSLNLRWLPDFIDLYQRLRMEPVRISYQPTSHDPLSQGTGHYSFLMDADQKLWLAQGEKELNLAGIISKKGTLSAPIDAYMLIEDNATVPIVTMRLKPPSAGSYRLTLINAKGKPQSGKVRVSCQAAETTLLSNTIDPVQWSDKGALDLDISLTGKRTTLRIEPQACSLALAGILLTPQ